MIERRENECLVCMKGIRKIYSQTEVLHDVDFEVRKGEVHALMGENGAGKSTLVKILMGETGLSAGSILVDGEEVKILKPAEAHKLGLVMIHQEIHLIPEMTITDNIFAGREMRRYGIVQKKQQKILAAEALKALELEIPVNTKVRSLKPAQMQMVEIAAAVSFGARLIIMDEPTSSISQKETEKLFSVIRKLKEQGISFVYISHRLDEIFEIADRITVLRDGACVSSGDAAAYTKEALVNLMVGRELNEYFPEASETKSEEVVLRVSGLTRSNEFEEIGFELHKGEILGFGGLVGAGRTEMATALFGMNKLDKGEIWLKGKQVQIKNARDAVKHGIALIPEDRKIVGLNLNGSVLDNLVEVVEKKISKFYCIQRETRKRLALDMIQQLSIKINSAGQLAGSLSGGNQQKVVLAKWLLNNPDILILDEPTRGIDVGAKAEIYKLIRDMAGQGKSIIFISSEMPELIGMCDRIIVLCEGKITGTLNREEVTQEKIMAFASNLN